jgi:MoaA/NifB/PqqE/SkfB family radical SAM enzyme
MRNIPKKAAILDYSGCNAKCIHCNRGALNDSDDLDSLSDEEILEAIEVLKSRGVRGFNFSGGEPTLNPSLDMFIECAADKNEKGKPRNRVSISTNGSWGDDARNKLIEYHQLGVKKIGLSLDGFEKTHDSVRGFPGLHDKVMGIIEAAISCREDGTPIPHVNLNVVAQPKNVDELEGLARKFTDKGFHVYINFVTRYGKGWNLELSEEQVEKINAARRYLKERGVNIDPKVGIDRLYRYSFKEFKKRLNKKRLNCSRYEKGFEIVMLSNDGSLFLCPHFFTPYAVTIGNVRERKLGLILDDFKRGTEKDFYWSFIDPAGAEERRKFLKELDIGRYEGIRWSKRCIPCTILSSFVYFRRQGYNVDEANDLTEKIAKGRRIF